jgi:hypothetical protein
MIPALLGFAAFVGILFALWWPRQRELMKLKQRIKELEDGPGVAPIPLDESRLNDKR